VTRYRRTRTAKNHCNHQKACPGRKRLGDEGQWEGGTDRATTGMRCEASRTLGESIAKNKKRAEGCKKANDTATSRKKLGKKQGRPVHYSDQNTIKPRALKNWKKPKMSQNWGKKYKEKITGPTEERRFPGNHHCRDQQNKRLKQKKLTPEVASGTRKGERLGRLKINAGARARNAQIDILTAGGTQANIKNEKKKG